MSWSLSVASWAGFQSSRAPVLPPVSARMFGRAPLCLTTRPSPRGQPPDRVSQMAGSSDTFQAASTPTGVLSRPPTAGSAVVVTVEGVDIGPPVRWLLATADAATSGGERPFPAGLRCRMPSDPVRKIAAGSLTPGQPTPGMLREEAFAVAGVWTGRALTEPGQSSGWHHHGEHDTVMYVVCGAIEVETADGEVRGNPGDFLHVPPHTVHREHNPASERSEVVLLRHGTGPVVVNVEPPTGR